MIYSKVDEGLNVFRTLTFLVLCINNDALKLLLVIVV